MLSTRITAQMPIIMNFTKPKVAEVVKEEDYKVLYDPQSRVSYICGGGGSRPTGSTSQKGYRQTTERGRYSGGDFNGVVSYHNDAPVMTDD